MVNIKTIFLMLTGAVMLASSAPPPSECVISGTFQAHETDCQMFYICDHGAWKSFTCGAGTVFNPAINVCDWPSNVKCPSAANACDPSPCENGGTCTTSGTSFTCACPASYTGDTCQTFEPSDGTCKTTDPYKEDPEDCKNFQVCTAGGVWRTYRCPSSHPHFNVTTRSCDYIYNVQCGSRPALCTQNARGYGNDAECREFYICLSATWRLYRCPEPYRFNGQDCVANYHCPTASSTTTSTTTTTTTTTPTTTTTTVATTTTSPPGPCFSAPCKNGAICNNIGSSFYNCFCMPGYTGVNCETQISLAVNGAWSEWGSISTTGNCSKLCGGGERVYTRSRQCNNPPPSNGGVFCPGDAVETFNIPCNTGPCPCTASPCNGFPCTDVSRTEYTCECPSNRIGQNCETECTYPCPPNKQMMYPHLTNSSLIVICRQGELVVFPCPVGQTWSARHNRCCGDLNTCGV